MIRTMLHCSPKSANHIISAVTENRRTTVPYQNDSPDKKIQKMKFNAQWLQKYSLVTVWREVWCHDVNYVSKISRPIHLPLAFVQI